MLKSNPHSLTSFLNEFKNLMLGLLAAKISKKLIGDTFS